MLGPSLDCPFDGHKPLGEGFAMITCGAREMDRFEEEVDGLKVGGQAIAKAIRNEKMRREAEKKKAKRAAEAAATMERA